MNLDHTTVASLPELNIQDILVYPFLIPDSYKYSKASNLFPSDKVIILD